MRTGRVHTCASLGSAGVHVSAAELAERTGKSARHWQALAGAGKLPFASQPGGPGTAILFDLAGFEAWLVAGNLGKKKKWPRSTGATGSRGGASRSKAWSTAHPLKQRLLEKLRNA